MTDDEIKVTDKRMFTPDGELKEEYRQFEKGAADAEPAAEVVAEDEPAAEAETRGDRTQDAESPTDETQQGRVEIPLGDSGRDELSFFDLVGLVAQPIAIYLGDTKLPDGESAENLDMARLHIDLLEVLKTKTVGNLTAQEHAFLEDLLYQLRLRYVQKRG